MNIFLNNVLIDASTVDMINQIINGVSIGIFVLLIIGLMLLIPDVTKNRCTQGILLLLAFLKEFFLHHFACYLF